MIIGFLAFEIYLPYCHSLKEKRMRLACIKNRLRKKFNVAVAELDYHDKWQRSKIGFVTLNNQKTMIEKIFRAVEAEAQELIDGEIIRVETYFY